MKHKHILPFLFITLLIFNCHTKNNTEPIQEASVTPNTQTKNNTTTHSNKVIHHQVLQIDTSELIIIDSIGIGFKSIYNYENNLIKIEFHQQNKGEWIVMQSIDSIFSQSTQNEIDLMDFNFDGLDDIRLFTSTGGRGSNEYYEVFLRNKNNEFKRLKSSDMPPNIIPNSKTKKVEAVRFYGKTRFEDHFIINDSLILEKSREVWTNGNWTYTKNNQYDQNGVVSKSSIDSIFDDGENEYNPEVSE